LLLKGCFVILLWMPNGFFVMSECIELPLPLKTESMLLIAMLEHM